nr:MULTISPECIES: helix-turn-helix domain-containing protein [Mycobacterium]
MGACDRVRARRASMKRTLQRSKKTREQLLFELRNAYEGGASIRTLVASTGRSYGSIHSMLLQAGTTMRGRGGPNHTSRSAGV